MQKRAAAGAAIVVRLLRAHERWVRWVYTPVLAVVAAGLAPYFPPPGARGLSPPAPPPRWIITPTSCCPEGSADGALMKRFVQGLRSMRDPRGIRALLEPARIAETRRWMAGAGRVMVVHDIRQALLGWLRAKTGSPAIIL